jgi:hypothetical protein
MKNQFQSTSANESYSRIWPCLAVASGLCGMMMTMYAVCGLVLPTPDADFAKKADHQVVLPNATKLKL